MVTKLCDCGKSSDSSDTEMSTHSQQQLQSSSQGVSSSAGHGSGGSGSSGIMLEACQTNQLSQQRVIDGSRLLTLNRQPVDLRNHHDGIYSKQLAAAVGLQPSPGMTKVLSDKLLVLFSC